MGLIQAFGWRGVGQLWVLCVALISVSCTRSSDETRKPALEKPTSLRTLWDASSVRGFEVRDLSNPDRSMAFKREFEQAGAPWLIDIAPAGETYRDRFADANRTEHLLDVLLSSEIQPKTADCGRGLFEVRLTTENGNTRAASVCERKGTDAQALGVELDGQTHELKSSLPGFLKGIPEFKRFRRKILSLEERDFPFRVTIRMEAQSLLFTLEGSHWFSEGKLDSVFESWIEKVMQLQIVHFRDQKVTVGRTDCEPILKIEMVSWDERAEKLALQKCGATLFGWNDARSPSPFELDARVAEPLYTAAKTRLASSTSARSASK